VSAPRYLFQTNGIIGDMLRKGHQLHHLKPFHPCLRTNINKTKVSEQKNHYTEIFFVNLVFFALLTLGIMTTLLQPLSFDAKHAGLSGKFIGQMQKC